MPTKKMETSGKERTSSLVSEVGKDVDWLFFEGIWILQVSLLLRNVVCDEDLEDVFKYGQLNFDFRRAWAVWCSLLMKWRS